MENLEEFKRIRRQKPKNRQFYYHIEDLMLEEKGGPGSGSWSGPKDPRFNWQPKQKSKEETAYAQRAVSSTKKQWAGDSPKAPEGDYTKDDPAWKAWDEAYYDYRKKEDEWTFLNKQAIAEGRISVEDAKERGLRYFADVQEDQIKDMPSILYHVTTSADDAVQEGLKSRKELQLEDRAGLGGGPDDTISFTDDPKTARGIYDAMHEARSVARNEITMQDMIDAARKGEGANKPYLAPIIRHYGGADWKEGDPLPVGLETVLRGERYRTLGLGKTDEEIKVLGGTPSGYGWMGGDGKMRHVAYTMPMTEKEKLEERFDLYKAFATFRESAGGPLDPLFFAANPDQLAKKSPDQIQILKAQVPQGHKGYQVSALGEWRTWSARGMRFSIENPEGARKGDYLTAKGGPGSGSWEGPGDPRFNWQSKKPFEMTLYRGVGEINPKTGYVSDAGDFGRGEYWSSNEAQARQYGDVTKRKVRLEHPLIIDEREAYETLADKYGTVHGTKESRIAGAQRLTDDLIAQGYDGIVIVKKRGGFEVVVYSKAQKGGPGSGSWEGPQEPRFEWHPKQKPEETAERLGVQVTPAGQLRRSKVVDGVRVGWDGNPLPEHIQKLKIPPEWVKVYYAEDPDADLLAKGKPPRGKTKYVYSEKHKLESEANKYAKETELSQNFQSIYNENKALLENQDPTTRESASCLKLIMETGIRPGTEEKRGRKTAYGATTLEGRHVVELKRGLELHFQAKSGVFQRIPIRDEGTAKDLRMRAQRAGPNGRLFNIDEKTLLEHSQKLDGGGFNTKDFRTHIGTQAARDAIAQIKKIPTTMKEYKKAVREVGKIVGKRLGNTVTVALQSYINPTVFAEWKAAIS